MMMILQVTEDKDLAVNSTATVSKKKAFMTLKLTIKMNLIRSLRVLDQSFQKIWSRTLHIKLSYILF